MGEKKGVKVVPRNTHHYKTPKGNRYTFFKNRGLIIEDMDDIAHFSTCGGFSVEGYETTVKEEKIPEEKAEEEENEEEEESEPEPEVKIVKKKGRKKKGG